MVPGIDFAHQSICHLGDLISFVDQRLHSISGPRWVEPLTEFQGGDCFLKAAEGGYDGRGQAVLHSPTDAHKAWLYLGAEVCVVEKAVEIAQEISVLAARNPNGEISVVLKRDGKDKINAEIVLPQQLTGNFIWNGKTIALKGGKQVIKM